MNTLRITIIIAVNNGASTLERCLKSIFAQTYHNCELIIMDGGSNDGTVEILTQYSKRITYWESKPDKGIYSAWNKALGHSTGDWIGFLGADDYFWRGTIMCDLIPYLEEASQQGIRLVYGKVASIDNNCRVREILGSAWDGKASLERHIMPPHPGLMHRSDLFKELGGYNETYRIAGDYEYLLRILKTEKALFVPDKIVAGVRYGGISCDRSHLFELILEDMRARKENKIKAINAYTIKYYCRLIENSIKSLSS